MNNSKSIKNCPFCKNQIPAKAERCPICKMVLIEHLDLVKTREHQTLDPQIKNERLNNETFTNTEKTNRSAKYYLNKAYSFLKRKKIPITFSLIVFLFIFYFIYNSKSDNPERILYNYELEGKSKPKEKNNFSSKKKDNPSNNYEPTQIDKENTPSKSDEVSQSNQEGEDFNNIPEKFVQNGEIFLKNKKYFNGLGELTIKNGTNNDAVVKFVSKSLNKSVLTMYIRRNSNFTIKNIRNGNYKLYFVVGRHYDEEKKIFLKDCSFSVFEKDFPFTTDEYRLTDKIKTEYSIFEITLHPVVGGKARTDDITKNEFLSL